MKARAFGRFAAWVLLFVLIASSGCSGATAGGSASLPLASSSTQAPDNAKTGPLCEKLVAGVPSIGSKDNKNCSFVRYKHELNAAVCYSSTCSLPRDAKVELSEKGYQGKITASDKTRSLPKDIVSSSWFITGLCGDKAKDVSGDPADIIDISPAEHTGSSAKFTITDEGPRFKSGSGSSACNIVFYDSSDKFVEFDVFMS
jgi:hypothetical protein